MARGRKGTWTDLTGTTYEFTPTRLTGQTVYSSIFGTGGSQMTANPLPSNYTPAAATAVFVIDTAFPCDIVILTRFTEGSTIHSDTVGYYEPYVECMQGETYHYWARGDGTSGDRVTWETIASENISCYYYGTKYGVLVPAGTTGDVYAWTMDVSTYFTTGRTAIQFTPVLTIIPVTATEEQYTATGHFEVRT